jgi:arsenate reductase-like glutaredoxin family protein
MLILLANDACSKSNAATEWLERNKIFYQNRFYLLDSLTLSELELLVQALGQNAKDLLRTKSTEKVEEMIEIILKDPSQMQRPILWNFDAKKAAIGRPLKNLESVL